jgi:hypothetical protein
VSKRPLLDQLTHEIARKLRSFNLSSPNSSVLGYLLQTAYLASLHTEEGRFSRPSITFSDPKTPELNPPLLRRADYPSFFKFANRIPLTVESLVKLSRAVDHWSASIAVYGKRGLDVSAWGVVDQLVQTNVKLNQEGQSGFDNPGILTINVDGVGSISTYHGTVFLGALRGHRLLFRENDALRSRVVFDRIRSTLIPRAIGIANSLGTSIEPREVFNELYDAWVRTISRLCIGLRRLGSGGSFIITPSPQFGILDVTHEFDYPRLGDSMTLQVLDESYLWTLREEARAARSSGRIPTQLHYRIHLANADALDRETEVTGAAKMVTSLATADGAVLLTPCLCALGFGAKIGGGRNVRTVYDGAEFARNGRQAKTINLSGFGTRHRSVLRYCRSDRRAVGIVVSQDGHVRVIASVGKSLILWNDVRLLGYKGYSRSVARAEIKLRLDRQRERKRPELGYTSMPKTMGELIAAAQE